MSRSALVSFPLLRRLRCRDYAAVVQHGDFINALITFVSIAAAVLFFVVEPMNALMARRTQEDPDEKECPECTSAIPVKARRCPQCTAVVTQA
jgi:large conductance mechanosensitive channel